VITHDVVDGVATVTMDDPERRNALSNDAIASLRSIVDATGDDPDVRVVVITGSGESAFSAGGDLSGGFVDAPLEGHGDRGALADLFRAMWTNPKPIVGRVNGVALGGGFGLAVACDITIAVEEAKMGTPEIELGLWPMMISAVLMRSMPRKALLEMMLTGRVMEATAALELGLVNRVVPRSELDPVVGATVRTLLAKSPAALALGKRSFYGAQDLDADTALDLLHLGLTATALTEDGAEGVAAFLDRRPPHWSGR
jgi:enoyl-CoA hydratase/carnithine racemase